MNQHAVAQFASDLMSALQSLGYDEVFVTYLNGWERRATKSTSLTERVKFCWLATPLAS